MYSAPACKVASDTEAVLQAIEVSPGSEASRLELLELGLPFGNVNHRIERHA